MIFGMVSRRRLLKCVGLMAILSTGVAFPVARGDDENGRFSRHVLLISVDGLHAIDLERFVESHPQSALAELSRHGYTYTQASCSIPSDSFPGLLALITGGSPISTGVWYDNSYDRTFLPPGGGAPGTDLTYDETIDLDPSQLFGGGAINTSLLPLDPA